MRRKLFEHKDGCARVLYEGGTCTCDLVSSSGRDDYADEPSNMAEMENGETFGDLW